MQELLEKELYKSIQVETGLSTKDIKHITQYMFKQLRDTIREGELQRVDLQYLGSWWVKPGREYKLREEKNIKPKGKNYNDRII